MGLPITALLANNGRYESFPLYVWLADRSDGPTWNLMDREFDRWDERTGRHLAFFVDPFQKKEWAQAFLADVGMDRDLSAEVLRAASAARSFYRDRLSSNLARHLRIGVEFLPVAIVALAWDAPSAVVCFLRTEQDLPDPFEALIHLDGRMPRHPRSERFRDSESFVETRNLARHLGDRFDVQVYDFPRPLTEGIPDVLDAKSVHYFLEEFKRTVQQNPWTLGQQVDRRHARGFGLSKACVGLQSLDDLLDVAGEIDVLAGRLGARYPGDRDVRALGDRARRLADVKEQVDCLEAALRGALLNDRDDDVLKAFNAFEPHARPFDLVAHLIDTLGATTYGALSADSRDAVAASEFIYVLSVKLNELSKDLTGAMIGYWKASEIEGRRILHELMHHSLIVERHETGVDGGVKVTQFDRAAIDSLTLGGLKWAFAGLHLAPPDRAPALPLAILCRLLQHVVFRERNPATHRRPLRDRRSLEQARNNMGCRNPGGVLPILVSCLEAIDPALVPGLDEPRARVVEADLEFLKPSDNPLV